MERTGTNGVEIIPLDILPEAQVRNILEQDEPDLEALQELVGDYLQGKILSAEIDSGWCARLSADGYLDCTEWQGPYATEAEAIAEVCEVFDVDEDGEQVE